jgi:acid phosphatase
VLAGKQDRVIESAQWFAQGYFGRNWATLNAIAFSTINEDTVTPSWITPMVRNLVVHAYSICS